MRCLVFGCCHNRWLSVTSPLPPVLTATVDPLKPPIATTIPSSYSGDVYTNGLRPAQVQSSLPDLTSSAATRFGKLMISCSPLITIGVLHDPIQTAFESSPGLACPK